MGARRRRSGRIWPVLVSLFLLASCSPFSSDDDFIEVSVPLTEADLTYENAVACNEYLQPKAPVSGSEMDTTFLFYRALSEASSGTLSRQFIIVSQRITELAPYYNNDQFPPEEVMYNFQAAIYVVDYICDTILGNSSLISESTETETTPTTNAPSGFLSGSDACDYITREITFGPWDWDVYDIKADAEYDFGKTIGSSSYGIDSYLRNSFEKFIYRYETAASLTSSELIGRPLLLIANTLQDYIDSHDIIPYPNFENSIDVEIKKLVKMSEQACSSLNQDAATLPSSGSVTEQGNPSVASTPSTTRTTPAATPPMTSVPQSTTTVFAPRVTTTSGTLTTTVSTSSSSTTTTTVRGNPIIVSETYSAPSLRGTGPSINYQVTISCDSNCGTLPSSIGGRLCITRRNWQDASCTGAIMGGSRSGTLYTYSGLFIFGGSSNNQFYSAYLALPLNGSEVILLGSQTIQWLP